MKSLRLLSLSLATLVLVVALFCSPPGTNGQALSSGDTVIVIKPEEMRVLPKAELEKKLGLTEQNKQLEELIAEQIAVPEDRKKQIEEQRRKQEQEERKLAEEKRRKEEDRRKAEEQRRSEQEERQKAEEQRRKEHEERQKAEQRRKAQEEREKAEQRRKELEERQKVETERRKEQERQKAEEERRKTEEQRRKQEQEERAKSEQRRKEQERQKAEEQRRKEEGERKKVERPEDRKKAEAEQRRKEQERQKTEEQRRKEERRKEEEESEEEERKEMFESYVAVGVIKLLFDNTSEPFTLFYDGKTQRSRVDLGSKALVRSLQLPKLNRMYRIEFPNLETATPSERAICLETTGSHDKPIKALKAIPDLDRFERVGEDRLDDLNKLKVDKWKLEFKDPKKGHVQHTFWLFTEPKTRKPVRLELFARLLKSNKVVDHYRIDYKYFFPTRPSDDVFLKPSEIQCRSISGLSKAEEEKQQEKDQRFELGIESFHLNPLGKLIDPDTHLAFDREMDKLFDGFRRRFNKTYESSGDEYETRRAAFRHNYRYVNMVNRAGLSYRLRLNELADRTNDELRKMLGTHNVERMHEWQSHGVAFDPNVHNTRGIDRLPDEIDYRLLGAVTPIVNQGENCGSDWAIAAKSVIESALFLRSNRLVKLSPQELLDCGHETGNRDCNYGNPWQAYEYVLKNGIASEFAYGRYSQRKKECRRDAPISAKIRRWVLVGNNELDLKRAIAMNGPVAVTIDAAHKSFFFYASGVYNEPNCRRKATSTNHALVIVGYGKLPNSEQEYFLVKNSFSENWGLNGYMLIEAKGNLCGILSAPTFVDM